MAALSTQIRATPRPREHDRRLRDRRAIVTLRILLKFAAMLRGDYANRQRIVENEWRIEELVRRAFARDSLGGTARLTLVHGAALFAI
jgi:hypothetical protein